MDSSSPIGLRQRGPAVAVWALGGLCLSILVLRLRDFYQDDAYISLTYARNLLEGHGGT